jgi:hypothetical protein
MIHHSYVPDLVDPNDSDSDDDSDANDSDHDNDDDNGTPVPGTSLANSAPIAGVDQEEEEPTEPKVVQMETNGITKTNDNNDTLHDTKAEDEAHQQLVIEYGPQTGAFGL